MAEEGNKQSSRHIKLRGISKRSFFIFITFVALVLFGLKIQSDMRGTIKIYNRNTVNYETHEGSEVSVSFFEVVGSYNNADGKKCYIIAVVDSVTNDVMCYVPIDGFNGSYLTTFDDQLRLIDDGKNPSTLDMELSGQVSKIDTSNSEAVKSALVASGVSMSDINSRIVDYEITSTKGGIDWRVSVAVFVIIILLPVGVVLFIWIRKRIRRKHGNR